MKHILAIAFLFLVGAANADEIIVHVGSYHTSRTHEEYTDYVNIRGDVLYRETVNVPYNNTNPGIGYKTDEGWMVGYYDNSYNKPTFYAGKEWMFTDHFGAMLGLGTGYKQAIGYEISPLGGLVYKIPVTQTVTINTIFLPPIGKITGVVHLALSFKLGN
jgi:hypothetical protein